MIVEIATHGIMNNIIVVNVLKLIVILKTMPAKRRNMRN